MKKLAVILALTMSSVTNAQLVDVYIKFNDNSTTKYSGVPGMMDIEDFRAQVAKDFPNKTAIVDAKIVLANQVPTAISAPAPSPISSVSQSTITPVKPTLDMSDAASKAIGGVLTLALLSYGVKKFNGGPQEYPCVLPTDRAKDGSLCGGRASSVRPGGRP